MRRLRAPHALLVAAVAAAAVTGGAVRSVPAEEECVAIDDFAKDTIGQFPADWKARKESGKKVYAVQEENGLRFLRAESHGLGIQAAKQYEWDFAKYPILAWSWRPRVFPKGADERDSSTNDSALAVYLFVPYSRIAGPKAVKYVWSETVPVGTHLTSNYGLTQVLVVKSGTAGKDQWSEERVNALEDYRKLFGESGTPKPAGIGVLTDSDDTKSSAAGDYAKFRVCRG